MSKAEEVVPPVDDDARQSRLTQLMAPYLQRRAKVEADDEVTPGQGQ
jgi:hypothetical protein